MTLSQEELDDFVLELWCRHLRKPLPVDESFRARIREFIRESFEQGYASAQPETEKSRAEGRLLIPNMPFGFDPYRNPPLEVAVRATIESYQARNREFNQEIASRIQNHTWLSNPQPSKFAEALVKASAQAKDVPLEYLKKLRGRF